VPSQAVVPPRFSKSQLMTTSLCVLLVVAAAFFSTPAFAFAASLSSPGSLILPTNEWGLWTVLIVSAAAGLRAEKTQIGAALSSPLVTMFITLILVNVGILPVEAPLYNSVNKFLVPLAVPMLLLGADLRRVFRDTGSLLAAFLIGTFATVTSTVAAAAVLPMHGVEGAWKIAAALCSRHIGGAINYVAVSDVLQAPPATITAGIAADNLVVAVFFILLFALANQTPDDAPPMLSTGDGQANSTGGQEGQDKGGRARMSGASAPLKKEVKVQEEGAGRFSVEELALALAVSASVNLVAYQVVVTYALSG
jgi:hypothetical protein